MAIAASGTRPGPAPRPSRGFHTGGVSAPAVLPLAHLWHALNHPVHWPAGPTGAGVASGHAVVAEVTRPPKPPGGTPSRSAAAPAVGPCAAPVAGRWPRPRVGARRPPAGRQRAGAARRTPGPARVAGPGVRSHGTPSKASPAAVSSGPVAGVTRCTMCAGWWGALATRARSPAPWSATALAPGCRARGTRLSPPTHPSHGPGRAGPRCSQTPHAAASRAPGHRAVGAGWPPRAAHGPEGRRAAGRPPVGWPPRRSGARATRDDKPATVGARRSLR